MNFLQDNIFCRHRHPLLILIPLLFTVLTGHAQPANPIAQLKFEDAEKYFNAGDYEKALDYIHETEKLVGVTSKTLYLTIVTQDRLVAAGKGGSGLLDDLKANTKNYLKALEDQPIDDKYRTVYDISKKLSGYAGGKLNHASGAAGGAPGYGTSPAAVRQIIQAYHLAAFGSLHPPSIQSLKIETELSSDGQLVGRVTETKALHKLRMESVMGGFSTKMVFNNGSGYILFNGMKLPLTNPAEIGRQVDSPEKFITGKLDADNLAAASSAVGQFEGEAVDIIMADKVQYYFSRSSHLLMGSQVTSATAVVLTKYKNYRNYSGLLLPATVITETRSLSAAPAVQGQGLATAIAEETSQEPEESGQTAAIGLIGGRSRKKKRHGGQKRSALMMISKTAIGQAQTGGAGMQAASGVAPGRQKKNVTSGAAMGIVQALSGTFKGGPGTTTARIVSVQINIPINESDFN